MGSSSSRPISSNSSNTGSSGNTGSFSGGSKRPIYIPKTSSEIKKEALRHVLEKNGYKDIDRDPPPPYSACTGSHFSSSTNASGNRPVDYSYGGSIHKARAQVKTQTLSSNNLTNTRISNVEILTSSRASEKPTKASELPSSDHIKSDLPGKDSNFNSRNSINNVESCASTGDKNSNQEVKSKHETFLKKLAVAFSFSSSVINKGFFCSICNTYEIHYNRSKNPPGKHDDTEKHKENLIGNDKIKRHYCSKCRAHFFGDMNFWVSHLNSDFHNFFSSKVPKLNFVDKKRSTNKVPYNQNATKVNKFHDKPFNAIPSISTLDSLSCSKASDPIHINELIIERNIAEFFYNRLTNTGNKKYGFYCHRCKFLTIDENERKNHNKIHASDMNYMSTLKICGDCFLLIAGSDTLKQFHNGTKEHLIFKEFLSTKLNINNKLEPSACDKKDVNCDVSDKSDEGNGNYTDRTEGMKNNRRALLLKDLPAEVKRNVIFDAMKEFGRIDEIYMHFAGPNSAKVVFKFRFLAINIVNNDVPVIIKDKQVDTSLVEI